MADSTHQSNGSGNGALAFILGGVVVALGVIAWVLFGGGIPQGADRPDVSITLPDGTSLEGSVNESGS